MAKRNTTVATTGTKKGARFIPHFFCNAKHYGNDYAAALAAAKGDKGAQLEARVVKETPIDDKEWGTESIAKAPFTAATAKAISEDAEKFFNENAE